MDSSPLFSYTPVVLRKKQLEDPDIGPILKWKEFGKRPFGPEVCASSAMTRHYWNSLNLLEVQDGMPIHRLIRWDTTDDHLQLLVPRALQTEVI